MINGCSCNASGLYYGKAGLSLILSELALFYRNDYLEYHAFKLLQEALITKIKKIYFSDGLAGIGFTLLYLIEKKRVEAEYLEIFGKSHQKIIEVISHYNVGCHKFSETLGLYFYLHMTGKFLPARIFQKINSRFLINIEQYFENTYAGDLDVKCYSEIV